MDSKELEEIKKQIMAVDCPTILDPSMPNTTVMHKKIFLQEILQKRQAQSNTVKSPTTPNTTANTNLSQQAKDDFLQEMLQQRLASMNRANNIASKVAENQKEKQTQDELSFFSQAKNDEIDTLNFINTEKIEESENEIELFPNVSEQDKQDTLNFVMQQKQNDSNTAELELFPDVSNQAYNENNQKISYIANDDKNVSKKQTELIDKNDDDSEELIFEPDVKSNFVVDAVSQRLLTKQQSEVERLLANIQKLKAEQAEQEKKVQLLKAEREKLEAPIPYYLGSVSVPGFTFMHKRKFMLGDEKQEVEEYMHEATGMEFILIPAGVTQIGSHHFASEEPIRTIKMNAFFLAKYTCTQQQWKKIMNTTPWQGQKYVKNGDNFPAVFISWNDCKEFCLRTGLVLPSEVQWEYACRGRRNTDFSFGIDSSLSDEYVWDKQNAGQCIDKYAHEVGQKAPNLYGLYDMHGNVYEWCEDDWHPTYQGAPSTEEAWISFPRTSHRVNRGGSFSSLSLFYRSANRSSSPVTEKLNNLGVRFCYNIQK